MEHAYRPPTLPLCRFYQRVAAPTAQAGVPTGQPEERPLVPSPTPAQTLKHKG